MLAAQDVGHRVVVRRFVREGRDGRPLFGDLIGQLIEFGDQDLVLHTRDGTVHRVRRTDIVAAKRVPPWRPANRKILALERAAAAGWPAPVAEPLGEWLLRAGGGWSNRANSVLAIGSPGIPLDQAIDATARWYESHALTPRITTPLPLSAAVADALAARGWTAQPTTLVQTAPLAAIPTTPGPPVHLAPSPSAAWLDAVSGRKDGDPSAARQILTAVAEVRFAEVPEPPEPAGPLPEPPEPAGPLPEPPEPAGPLPEPPEPAGPLAVARGAITDGWLGISLVAVVPQARRNGLARRVTRALADWAGSTGVTRAYLQVEEHNEAAVRLYAGLGFTTHHTYVTWRR